LRIDLGQFLGLRAETMKSRKWLCRSLRRIIISETETLAAVQFESLERSIHLPRFEGALSAARLGGAVESQPGVDNIYLVQRLVDSKLRNVSRYDRATDSFVDVDPGSL